MEQQSKAFHIWKAVEMAAKERAEALSDNEKSDNITRALIKKLFENLDTSINGDDLLSLLRILGGNPKTRIQDLNPAILEELRLWETVEYHLSKVLDASTAHPITSFEFRAIAISTLDNIRKALNKIEECYTT